MKTISFFSEKGGVGKTTFGIMYASWLKYKHGIKIGVIDFNNRILEYREREKLDRKDFLSPEILQNAWPIETASPKKIKETLKGICAPNSYAVWTETLIREGSMKDMDVVVLDFPGNLSGKEFLELSLHKLINLVVMPCDRDIQTIQSTIKMSSFLHTNRQPFCAFMNQIQTYNKKSQIVEGIQMMQNIHKIPFLPDMISYSDRIKKLSEQDIIRSTFSCPDWDAKEFAGSRDLGTENLFIDVTRILKDKTNDLKGTAPADLSFVVSMKKDDSIQSLNRQINGTLFPELEIPLPEDIQQNFKKNI